MAPPEPLAAIAASTSYGSERAREDQARPAFAILMAIGFSHLLNDTIQSILPAIYPFLKSAFALSFAQVGLMTLALMLTASLLQPLVGVYTDRWPMPYSLVIGMGFSLAGLMLLAFAGSYALLLVAAGLLGVGSSVFHPEASRIARMASGGRHGLAQALFQVGGNVGSAIGPLIGAFLIVPRGQSSIVWCSLLALAAIVVLWRIGGWSATRMPRTGKTLAGSAAVRQAGGVSRRRVGWSSRSWRADLFKIFTWRA
jgi:FSR family fosmidomycin resistance protein-like MFS transporter